MDPKKLSYFPHGFDLQAHLDTIENAMIDMAMEQTQGAISKAAELLGIGRTCLSMKLKKRRNAGYYDGEKLRRVEADQRDDRGL